MGKILFTISFFLLSAWVLADGGNDFVFRKGKTWLDVQAFRMSDPLEVSGNSETGVRIEKRVPEKQNTIVYQVTLPEYQEGLFFSRDYRPGDYSWPHNTNRLLPWSFRQLTDLLDPAYPGIPSNGKVLLQGDALLLHLANGRYLFLKAVAGENSISWLKVAPEGTLELYVSTLGQDYLEKKVPLMLYGCDQSIYSVMSKAYHQLSRDGTVADIRLREKKVLPEPFHYLGWCSWEHYFKDIDERQLVADIHEIENSGLPIRYVLIDDGHVQNNKDQLTSFRPDPVKFPNGWQPVLQARREDKIRWMGLWYALPGYWQGIAVNNDFPDEIRKCLFEQNGSLLPGKSKENIEAYYQYYLETLRSYGFDFLKIDIQSLQLPLYMGGTEVIRQARACNRALEKETQKLGMGLINCMAHNILNTDNTRYSAVTRVSIDYQKFNEDMARSHLFQSYVNTLLLGQTVWPDHDMFHSCDSICGGMMARSKALSGGPVYLSDAPVSFVPELVWPLIDSEGKLFRPEAPAVPAPESVFTDPFWSGKGWKVVAPVGEKAMAMVCYNLNKNIGKVEIHLKPEEYLSREIFFGQKALQPAGILLYDWQNQTAEELKSEKTVILEGFTDQLFYFCPIVHGWGVIGLQEKYLSPATVRMVSCNAKQLIIDVLDKGVLNIWQDGQLKKIKVEKPGQIILTK